MIRLHIFDMDHTLIESDCDVTWKEFLVSEGIAPADALRESERFFDQYNRGCMDQDEFNAFQLRETVGLTEPELKELSRRHFVRMVLPNIRPRARQFVDETLRSGVPCVILSSTCRPLVAPVAEHFGVAEFYGTRLAMRDSRYTGGIEGDYLAGEGKVRALRQLCEKYGIAPAEVAAYGDSINDAPLLEAVGAPAAVSPSPTLRKLAETNKWRILDWRT